MEMKVQKRNGTIESFDINKMAKAIYKARLDANEERTIEECVAEAREILEWLPYGERTLTIEEIQDAIENSFMQQGNIDSFKQFTIYREKRAADRENPWSTNDDRQDLILSKYTIQGESKKEFIDRVTFSNTDLAKIFRNREGIWGGRNLYAVGREGNITGSNCYVATAPQDNLEDIYRVDYEIARTYSFGGGQGFNLSNLRPKGAKVNNSSNTTPGVMTFAEKFSHTTLNTQQENRRGALMLVLNVDHPDVIDFITKKLDLSAVNGANISLAVTDAFMSAVENDEDWVMKFETPHEIIEKRVRARQLMHLIAYANHTVGDPGFLLMDNINNYHLLSEYPEVHFNATNPCGEQPLMENGSCNLGSINLNAFVRRPFTDDALFDLDRFREVVKQMTWGLDELLTILGDRHALPAQREHVKQWREIGLGVMGLADMALSMNMAYGSPEFIAVLDNVMKEMANAAGQASALRAKELGAFPKFNLEYTEASKFYQDVYTEETKAMIREHGLRNSRILSIAPTGSISNVLGVSGGVEPFFMLGYQREIKSFGEEPMKIWVVEKTPKKLMDRLGLKSPEELPEWAKVTSQNIKFEDRALVQATIQKYVDTAISSTFNVHADAKVKDIEDIYMVSWKYGLKGATVFRDKCKKAGILSDGGQILNYNPAPFPWITVDEKWTEKLWTYQNKAITGDTREFSTHIQITDEKYKTQKFDIERCPLCESSLVKQSGCTKCSNPECVYEKCAL